MTDTQVRPRPLPQPWKLTEPFWEAARNVMGKIVVDVLITEIARQDS